MNLAFITGGALVTLLIFCSNHYSDCIYTVICSNRFMDFCSCSRCESRYFHISGMRLRRVKPKRVIDPMIKAHKAGIKLTTNQLESHFLAGGNVDRVVDALIAAQRADISLTFERCAAIDLAGRDVLKQYR